ncbi:NAD-dependent epimerase/dehydratase family protein [Planomonospora sp. ID67723]|uniref:NAD-dependent epimerase/dehydratase family protein n=1 Tax=Planomonospora sp. ID67723 TaxID=2738134 RepID=UPI0018C4162A|nr:NAD-dependent epimerase/dehydratase family protein [Planomonospora sp. ID67723]MBG0827812.1 NAD-dependent epimerase/dehydratase family protein [Planomonospora sp. ID67723]
MRVLVLGATGYIGSAVAERLAERGHRVVALVRPKPGEARVVPGAAEVRHGDVTDPASLAAGDVDVIVHASAPTGDEAVELAALDALLAGGARLVYTSGIWVLGAGAADEESPVNPIPLVRFRAGAERRVLGAGGVVVRPGIVYGEGGGIPALLAAKAAEQGRGRYVSADGREPTWPTVHVGDLADLFAAVVERGEPGAIYHGVGEEAVPLPAIAKAAAEAAGLGGAEAEAWPVEEAAGDFGPAFAEALALGQSVSAARTRKALDWTPSRPGLVADLAGGSY